MEVVVRPKSPANYRVRQMSSVRLRKQVDRVRAFAAELIQQPINKELNNRDHPTRNECTDMHGLYRINRHRCYTGRSIGQILSEDLDPVSVVAGSSAN